MPSPFESNALKSFEAEAVVPFVPVPFVPVPEAALDELDMLPVVLLSAVLLPVSDEFIPDEFVPEFMSVEEPVVSLFILLFIEPLTPEEVLPVADEPPPEEPLFPVLPPEPAAIAGAARTTVNAVIMMSFLISMIVSFRDYVCFFSLTRCDDYCSFITTIHKMVTILHKCASLGIFRSHSSFKKYAVNSAHRRGNVMSAAKQQNYTHITPIEKFSMDRNLAMEAVRVTEAAALAASRLVGHGNEKAADAAAVDAMREALNSLEIRGTVVIGEGERDEAPMLYIGEEVGVGGPEIDIALDPLEGTTITAKGGQNALAVMAMADKGSFLNAPDTYMQKIAVGPGYPDNILDLDAPPQDILKKLAKTKEARVEDLLVCILDRPRHDHLIAAVRAAGARIALIQDGDVSGVIATTDPDSGIDLYIGTGGAPEGVLAAAALQCTGGQMLGRLVFRNKDEIARAEKWKITDLNRIYTLDDLAAPRNVMFAATGVTDGAMLKGVRRRPGGATTHSIVMRSKSGTIRKIEAEHNFMRKSGLDH
jgi:fructose-1,6-bisphosphatase II / sedoheptulose-1,7-bisphosphatase